MNRTSRAGAAARAVGVSQLLGVSAAWAADTATLDQVEVYPTFAAASVYADFTGDDDGDLRAWVEYREAGAASVQRGHELLPVAGVAGGIGAGPRAPARLVSDREDR